MRKSLMTCAECDELALDHFEGSLDAPASARFDEHVLSCQRCLGLIRDINAIREQATDLPELSPSRDLWSGIASRIRPEVQSVSSWQRSRVSSRWVLAAAAALIVVTSGVTYVATSHSLKAPATVASMPALVRPVERGVAAAPAGTTPEAASPTTIEIPAAGTQSVARGRVPSVAGRSGTRASLASSAPSAAPVTSSEKAFAGEINQLQSVLVERREQLAPETVKVVEDNLKVIDTAVKRARAALARDPASGFLTRQLDNVLQKKVELLRTAALLPAAT